MRNIEEQIEQLRLQMYHAYNQNHYNLVLKISTELDTLLNKLAKETKVK